MGKVLEFVERNKGIPSCEYTTPAKIVPLWEKIEGNLIVSSSSSLIVQCTSLEFTGQSFDQAACQALYILRTPGITVDPRVTEIKLTVRNN